jgi:D-alanine--poly(phosphoribitol) ligase subunit 1
MNRITDEFIENCFKYPNNNAIHINEKHYTYFELSQLIYPILVNLKNQNIKEDKIAVFCSDDIETYISILALSIYGVCYVPINSKNPTTHNLNILSTASIKSILHSDKIELNDNFKEYIGIKINSNPEENSITKELFKPYIHQKYAYLLYTSGSTGIPKGVAITHKQTEFFFNYFNKKNGFNFTKNDRFIQSFELTFDVSIFSLFMPLKIGACCYIVPQNGITFIETIRVLKDHSITIATFVPTILNHIEKYISEINLLSLKYSLFIGDKLIHTLTSKWSKIIPNAEIINFYGPTEATIMCSSYNWNEAISKTESFNDVVPIGKLFPELDYILVDENNLILSTEQIGELCISGEQVINQYFKNTNNGSFLNLNNNKIYYKTGDLVSLNENNNLLFHSRCDRQVKINAHRVELNEVESVIRKKISFPFSLLINKNNKNIDELILFIEINKDLDFETDKILFILKEELPDYMIPNEIIKLEKLPLNLNQKIDLNELSYIYNKIQLKK